MQTQESIEITQLKSLGIDEKFFPDNLTNEEAALLYKKLKSPMTTFEPCLIIKKKWQLYILAKQKLPDSIDLTAEKDNWATPPLHYLAWSDNLEEFLKSSETHPELFSAVNGNGRNVLHYLASSENAKGLATFKDHPLFTAVDNGGWTVFHCLARSGNADGLATFKDHPLFTAVDNRGSTVLHYLALAGNAEGLATFKDHPLFTAVDNGGWTVFHSLARSGNAKGLATFKDHPLFTAVDNRGSTVLHYLALAGNAEGLATFKVHPLFTAVDKNELTVLHYLALAGNAEGLATFKDHPLFTAVDKNELTVLHCIALSGNAEGLLAFSNTHPELFKAVDKNGLSIAHYAAPSKNPKALAIAWNFMGEDNQKKFYKLEEISSSQKIIMFETVESALKNNYRLPFGDNVQPQSSLSITDEQKAIISKLHQRNQAMDDTVISFKVFLLGLVQDENKNPIAKIARDVLFEIFKRMLPEGIEDNNKIIAVFNKIFNKMQPEERIKQQPILIKQAQQRLLREKASKTVPSVITAEINKLTNFSLNKMLNPTITQGKITALNKLKDLVNNTNNPLTLDIMKEWYAAYGPIINLGRPPLRKFFQPEHITSTRMLVTNICKAFEFKEKEVTENSVAERRVTTPHY